MSESYSAGALPIGLSSSGLNSSSLDGRNQFFWKIEIAGDDGGLEPAECRSHETGQSTTSSSQHHGSDKSRGTFCLFWLDPCTVSVLYRCLRDVLRMLSTSASFLNVSEL